MRQPGRIRNVAFTLILVNIIFFILQMILGSKGFTELLWLDQSKILLQPWRLITSMFLHSGFNHLFFNMYALFIFGPLIEQRIGSKRFATIYFASGLLAGIASAFFYPIALGASGAIMGILGVTIMLMPDLRVLLFFVIPMSLRTAGIIFALIDIVGIFNESSGIANIAHLAGLSSGLIYGRYLLSVKKKFVVKFTEPKHKHTTKSSSTFSGSNNSNTYNNTIELDDKDMDEYLRNGRL